MRMRAWYDIVRLDARGQDEAGIRRSAASIGDLIAREIDRGVPSSRIVLAGFSPGRRDRVVHRPATRRPAGRHPRVVRVSSAAQVPPGRGQRGEPSGRDPAGARTARRGGAVSTRGATAPRCCARPVTVSSGASMRWPTKSVSRKCRKSDGGWTVCSDRERGTRDPLTGSG